jgi:nucleoside-diphosphate-sugar epimerase
VRYALTGATGFVGGRLAHLLSEEGHEVAALVRAPERARRLADLGVHLVRGDLGDRAALARLLTGADGFFHAAGWYHVGADDVAEGYRVNVLGTRAVLAAAEAAGTPRIVYTSTLAVNSDTHGAVRSETYVFTGRQLSVYDETKALAHRHALERAAAGLPVVLVMPGLVYGPGDTSQTGALLRDVLRRRRVLVPSTGRLCWAHVDDVARGHLLAMQRGVPGQAYMLAGPVHSLAEGLTLGARRGGGRRPTAVPGPLVRALATVSTLAARVLPVPATYRAETLRSAAASYLGTPAKAVAELGWSARTLAEGMPETVVEVRAQLLAARRRPDPAGEGAFPAPTGAP